MKEQGGLLKRGDIQLGFEEWEEIFKQEMGRKKATTCSENSREEELKGLRHILGLEHDKVLRSVKTAF